MGRRVSETSERIDGIVLRARDDNAREGADSTTWKWCRHAPVHWLSASTETTNEDSEWDDERGVRRVRRASKSNGIALHWDIVPCKVFVIVVVVEGRWRRCDSEVAVQRFRAGPEGLCRSAICRTSFSSLRPRGQ